MDNNIYCIDYLPAVDDEVEIRNPGRIYPTFARQADRLYDNVHISERFYQDDQSFYIGEVGILKSVTYGEYNDCKTAYLRGDSVVVFCLVRIPIIPTRGFDGVEAEYKDAVIDVRGIVQIQSPDACLFARNTAFLRKSRIM